MARRFAFAALAALTFAGCSQQQLDTFTGGLVQFNGKVQRYAPIVGKDLILVGNILVNVECSPLMPVAGQVAKKVLLITAPTSQAAATVSGILAANADIAMALCPLVSAVQASVGAVQQGNPSQVVPAK